MNNKKIQISYLNQVELQFLCMHNEDVLIDNSTFLSAIARNVGAQIDNFFNYPEFKETDMYDIIFYVNKSKESEIKNLTKQESILKVKEKLNKLI